MGTLKKNWKQLETNQRILKLLFRQLQLSPNTHQSYLSCFPDSLYSGSLYLIKENKSPQN